MTLHDSLYYATAEDVRFFEEATAGLPKREPHEPYHCGPQNVRAFRYARSEVAFKTKHIGLTLHEPIRLLEIGFNLGHSAACWLALRCEVTSTDNRFEDRILEAQRFLWDEKRFRFYGRGALDSFEAGEIKADLAFIDGDHEYDGVTKDIALCRKHGITRFLFDDWYPEHGPGVQPAVFGAGLLPVAILGSMAYCVEPSAHGYVKQKEI